MARYQGRLSGPLLDRIDLQVEVPAAKPAELLALPEGEGSETVARRVAGARVLAHARQGVANAMLEPSALDALCAPAPDALAFLRSAAERLGWSGRGLHRTLKVARTIADLAGSDRIAVEHVAEALQFRRGIGR